MKLLVSILIIIVLFTVGVLIIRLSIKRLDINILKKDNSNYSNDNEEFINFVKENTDYKEFSEFVEKSINNMDIKKEDN